MCILEVLLKSKLCTSRKQALWFIHSGLVSQGKRVFSSGWDNCLPPHEILIRVGNRRIEFLDI